MFQAIKRAAAALVLASLAGTAATADSAVAGWNIVSSPGIARCAAEMQYPDGTILLMYYDARVQMYFFALSNDRWTTLHDGDGSVALKVGFSGIAHAHTVRAQVHALRYFFKADQEFVSDFREALTMTVTFEARQSLTFALKGTKLAMTAAAACGRRKLAGDTSDPFAQPEPAAPLR